MDLKHLVIDLPIGREDQLDGEPAAHSRWCRVPTAAGEQHGERHETEYGRNVLERQHAPGGELNIP